MIIQQRERQARLSSILQRWYNLDSIIEMKKLNNFINLFRFARNASKPSSKNGQQSTLKPIISELEERCLISIEGPDAQKILQGITTNDIDKVTQNPRHASQYTAFLNIKGRVVADAIIIKPRIFTKGASEYKENQYWLDVHKSLKQKLTAHIGKYCWKKQAKLQDIQTQVKVCVVYNDPRIATIQTKDCGLLVEPEEALKGTEGRYANISFVDPRIPSLGVRMLMNGDEYDNENFNIFPSVNYELYQTLHGVCDGPEIAEKIPFHYNLDLLRGISFTKGCYIGQQLIARSYHTGIIRRRIFPFVLQEESESDDLAIGKSFVVNGKEIAKVVKFDKNNRIGLALVNYLDVEPFELQLKVTSPAQVSILNPLRHQINEYLQTLKEKQKAQQKLDE